MHEVVLVNPPNLRKVPDDLRGCFQLLGFMFYKSKVYPSFGIVLTGQFSNMV